MTTYMALLLGDLAALLVIDNATVLLGHVLADLVLDSLALSLGGHLAHSLGVGDAFLLLHRLTLPLELGAAFLDRGEILTHERNNAKKIITWSYSVEHCSSWTVSVLSLIHI